MGLETAAPPKWTAIETGGDHATISMRLGYAAARM